jgi:hypothetical protein
MQGEVNGIRTTPAAAAARVEARARLPPGDAERFSGYGVIGLSFSSGHVLALRRWASSSIGPPYTSVWHRDPGGRWTFWADAEPALACARYTSRAASASPRAEIGIQWTGPFSFSVSVPDAGLEWRLRLADTAATRALSLMAARLPESAWEYAPVLRWMGAAAGRLLDAGRLGLRGRMPNGQWFRASPRRVWAVESSNAVLGGRDLGPPGPLAGQARLGDFWMPQRGLFAVGQAHFERLDPVRHAPAAPALAGLAGGAP